jgi:Fe2+ transport system protein FeoA
MDFKNKRKIMNVTDLANGGFATVKQLCGSRQFVSKMEAMGIVPGAVILKKNDSILRGPVVIEWGATQLAFGIRFAKNIIVELL